MKTILSLAALMLLVSLTAFGQNNAVSTVSFTVTDGIVVTGDAYEWGDLAPGVTYTITPDGYVTPPLLGEDPEVGDYLQWEIAGIPGTVVTINIILPSYFVGQSTGARVPYSVNAQSGGIFTTSVAPEEPYVPFDPRAPISAAIGVDGLFVGLGGIVSVPATGMPAADEEYLGTFILTASISGL